MTINLSIKKLKKSFYRKEVVVVARELLGKVLVKSNGKENLAGKIVEVEAYHGDLDEAAHSYGGITERNEIMFEAGGYLYVYFTYGAHHCCNVVTGKKGQGTAVLIRAVEPVFGLERMIKNRFGRKLKNEKEIFNLTSGPGKVCQAFKLDRSHSGTDLTGDKIFILDGVKIKSKDIGISKRIGITRSVDLPWRFFIKDNPYLSRK
ncbi:MAG: DNA-3-methyladenine glycosylase [Ignavibacteriaceae bacterium]|nr:DNA-3-methyladenine glycosylase [Ignavibacteriaceae bacterium]MCU0364432.1 DNA-3-methyladenine glycosylase [Ignavibacteriaceae bacterium]